MKKYREFIGVNAVMFIIGCLIMAIGTVWSIYNFFDVWDVVMSKKQLLVHNWKAIATLIIGFALFTISVNRANLK